LSEIVFFADPKMTLNARVGPVFEELWSEFFEGFNRFLGMEIGGSTKLEAEVPGDLGEFFLSKYYPKSGAENASFAPGGFRGTRQGTLTCRSEFQKSL